MGDFFNFILCCQSGPDNLLEEEEAEAEDSRETEEAIGQNKSNPYNENISSDGISDTNLIDVKYLLAEEKNIFPSFTKETIISFIDSLDTISNSWHWYKSDNLNFYVNKDGSPITKDFYLCTTTFIINKEELYKSTQSDKSLSLEMWGQMFTDPSIRKKWDSGVSAYDDLEIFDCKPSKHADIKCKLIHASYHAPIKTCDKRDWVDKWITIKDNNVWYSYQSSINEIYGQIRYQIEEDTVRAMTYVNSSKIWEDEKSFNFTSYYQTNLKLMVPEMIWQMVVPFTIRKFYERYTEKISEIFLS